MDGPKLPLHIRMLEIELLRRKEKNPRYSLRAFARFLDIHPSALSRVLNGKQDLALETCASVIEKLALQFDDARLFIASVAEDKRLKSAALLVRAIDPKLLEHLDFEPRPESIMAKDERRPLQPNDVLALGSDIISMMDLKGRFIFADETASKTLQTIPCDLIGEKWSGTKLDLTTAQLLEKQEQQVVTEQIERSFEFTMPDGKAERHFIRTITPVLGADGKMHAFISSIRDVTFDKTMRDAIKSIHSSIELNTVLQTIPRVTTQVLASAAVLELRKPDGTLHLVSAHHIDEIRPDEFLDFFVLTGLNSANLEARKSILRFKGSPAAANVIMTPLRSSGQQLGTLVLFHENEFTDERIRRANELAESAAQAIVNARACS